jgi:hypothetical protein
LVDYRQGQKKWQVSAESGTVKKTINTGIRQGERR